MKKIVFLILLLSNVLFLFSQNQNRELTDTEKILGLSRLWEGVRNNFVYYDRLPFDWDSLYAVSIRKVLDVKDTYAYVKELEKIAASVRDGHTFVMHSIAPEWEERLTPAPFTTQLIHGKVFVDKIWSSELIKKGVTRGTEIVTMDDMEVIKYGEEILGQYIASSTPQWLHHKVFNEYELTKGKRTESITIGFNNGKKVFHLTLERNQKWDLQDAEREAGNNEEEPYYPMEFKKIHANAGLLKINSFMDAHFIQLFDSLYADITETEALIIDLRNNGGGNSYYADYILRHLSSQPIRTSSWSSRMYIPAHASWNYSPEWYGSASDYLSPVKDKKIYDKPIAVLINAGTFSSAEDFCVKFKGMKRGKIIGTPTGGSTGNGVAITLVEDLIKANICAKKDMAPDGSVFVGIGVLPDIEIQETKQDFMDRKDVVLERGLTEVTGK